jgi:hypothetical protein
MFMTPYRIRHNPILAQSPQAGISLMLGILVLAAITAVAFSLAAIVFIEVRSSGDVTRTEPAMYAALGVTEEALFQYKRYIVDDPQLDDDFNVPTCEPQNAKICQLNGVTLTMPPPQPIEYDESPRVIFVPTGTRLVLPMYLQNDYNQAYSSVEVEVLPTSTKEISISFLKTTPDAQVPAECPGGSIAAGDPPYQCTSFSDAQYDLVLDNQSNEDISVSVETVRVGNGQPAGLPFLGQRVLRILAEYLGLSRTYEVKIPVP